MRRLDVHMRDNETFDTVMRVIKAADPIDYMVIPVEQSDRRLISIFLRDETGQMLMDNLQTCLEKESDWRISLLPIEATAPKLEENKKDAEHANRTKQALREEIFNDIEVGAELNRDFLILVVLSTIVAAIGLHSNSSAAVIGAMVIAPLLGPILGFSLGAALGDRHLVVDSSRTLLVGVSLALVSAVLISLVIDVNFESRELMSRAEVRLDGVALAIAAGAAAALSLAKGQGAVLVGVMVAAALLPPGAALGLFAGSGEWELAMRAGLLLALNVASLVLSALVVFRLKQIRPRRWIEQKNANRAIFINAGLSVAFLVLATFLIVYLDLGTQVSIG